MSYEQTFGESDSNTTKKYISTIDRKLSIVSIACQKRDAWTKASIPGIPFPELHCTPLDSDESSLSHPRAGQIVKNTHPSGSNLDFTYTTNSKLHLTMFFILVIEYTKGGRKVPEMFQ